MSTRRRTAPDSDDDSDDESSVDSVLSADMLLPASAGDSVEVLSDSHFPSIGEQIAELERECMDALERKRAEWKKVNSPVLKGLIESTERQISALQQRIEESTASGLPTSSLERQLDELLEKQDTAKRDLYFPHSLHKFGNEGIYFAFDDIWLENISSKLEVELLPAMGSECGTVVFLLSGLNYTDPGVTAKLHFGDFKLAGDSMTIPSISLDDVVVEIVFTVSIVLYYDIEEKKWRSSADDFSIKLIEFTGPFGLSRSIVSTLLGIMTPLMRARILKDLPIELGAFVSTLPVPFKISGSFSIDGAQTLDSMSSRMFMSPRICKMIGCTPRQMLNFIGLQKSLGRDPLIHSMHDMVRYKRRYEFHEHWKDIKLLWEEAAMVYFSMVAKKRNGPLSASRGGDQQDCVEFLSFDLLLSGAAKVMQNYITFRIDLDNVEGQIGIGNVVGTIRDYLIRRVEEISTSSSAEVSRAEKKVLKSMSTRLNKITDMFNLVLKNLDFLQCKFGVRAVSGESAKLNITLEDVTGQAALALWNPIPTSQVIGIDFIVPFLFNLESWSSGLLNVKMYHLGCLEMLQSCNFERYIDRSKTSDSEHASDSCGKFIASELMSIDIMRPVFTLVAEKAVTFEPGEALMTLQVGPVDSHWTPQGCKSTDRSYLADIKPIKECPLLAQTSNNVKVQAKIPTVDASIDMIAFTQFLNDHFNYVDDLLDVITWIRSNTKERNVKYIDFAKIVLSMISKYIREPGVELWLKLSTRVVASPRDVIVCIENQNHNQSSALKLCATFKIDELLEDMEILRKSFCFLFNE